ncbi:hypothetical protein UFOVP981_20 [uncultured Caudovirales phage]|uniref:Uncharacterized protein n=1 Tax=uncultured Caudovirales phage TaxID=2100421 RepID=A0A6J5PZB4_9CAUD|nr:hypothetical protein UFOVP981_20 [uncultured Caudovirales phage]CAB4222451.1 hypothetical protein UFOVP1652_6 [uncultured Caudovirales phage]
MNQAEVEAYNRKEIREVVRAFKAMNDAAITEAKKVSGALADYALGKIQIAAGTRQVAGKVAVRIAQGGKVSKTSKIGEISLGFASQRFSGGGTTRGLWGGMEFGSNRFKQFPKRTPSQGRGNAGYFIYPTLKAAQPHIINEWQNAFSQIIKEF